jgi:phage baseplate assembly protein W
MAINIRFPLQDDTDKNRLFRLNEVSNNALSSNLFLLLLTEKGERYYNPEYGTNLKRFIFEPKDGITQADINEDIRATVKRFIPELTITNIQFFKDVDDQGAEVGENEIRVLIDFQYDEDVFQDSGRLEITF